MRILLTNILRLSWLTLPTIRPAMTQGSIGSAIRFTSTGNCADSPLLEKKYRGLRGKGHLHHKARPSRRATWKRNNTLSLRRYR